MTDNQKIKRFRASIKVGDCITHPEWNDSKDCLVLITYIDSQQDIFFTKLITPYGHDYDFQVRHIATDIGEYTTK